MGLGVALGVGGLGVRTLSGGGGPVALVPKLRDAGMHQAVSRVGDSLRSEKHFPAPFPCPSVYCVQHMYHFYLNNNLMTVNSHMQLMTVSDLQLGQKPR